MANVGAVARLHQREMILDKLKNILPLLDQNYDFTGKWYDPRDPNAPKQPNPELLRAHLPYLAQKYPNIPIQDQLQVGEPIEEFDPIDYYESASMLDSMGNMLMSGFNESLTGMGIMVGQQKLGMEPREVFDMSHWEASDFEKIGAMVASLAMPVDLATILVGGGVGGGIARTAISAALKRTIAKKILQGTTALGAKRAARKQFVNLMRRAAKDIPASAGAIGAYSGAGSTLDQIIKTGDFDMMETFIETLKGGALGAMVGTGGAVAGRFGRIGREVGHVGSGTAAFGVAAPMMEGEAPTAESMRGAFRFMVALRGIQGAAAIPGRARKFLKTKRQADFGPPEVAEAAETKLLKWDKSKDKIPKLPEETPSMKDLAKALYDNKLDRGAYNIARELVASRPDLDAKTAIRFSDEVKKFTKKELTDAGLAAETKGLVSTGTTKKLKGAEKDIVKTAIKLFKGADAETVVHEWNHDAYWRLNKTDKSLFGKYHKQSGNKKSSREHFADEATEFFFSEKLHEGAGPIRRLFERSKKALKQLIGRIRKFREAKIPKEILDLYRKELLRDRKTKMATVPTRPRLTTGGKVFGKGFTMEVAGAKTIRGDEGPVYPRGLVKEGGAGEGRRDLQRPKPKLPSRKAQEEIDFQIRRAEDAAETFGAKAKEAVKRGSRFFDPILPVEKRLRSAPGKQLAKDIQTAQAEAAALRGEYMELLRDAGVAHFTKFRQWITGQKAMTDWQGEQLVDAEGNMKSPHLSAVLEKFRQLVNANYNLNLKKIDRYFPRILKRDIAEKIYGDLEKLERSLGKLDTYSDEVIAGHLKGLNKWTQEALRHVQGKTLAAKIKALNDFAKQEIFQPARFEQARTLDLPSKFYETNVKEVLPKYIDIMSKRAGIAKVFGAKGERVLGEKGLLSKIFAEDATEGRVAAELLRQFTGVHETMAGLSPAARRFIDWYTAWQVGTKIGLGRATALNITQPAISFLSDMGIFYTVKGGVKLFDAKHRKMLRRGTGIVDRFMLEAVMGYEPGGWLGKFAKFTSRWSGFTAINKALQYWAASTANEAIPGYMRLARGSGMRARWAQKRLKTLGLDYRKPLTREQINKALYRFATDSQLQSNMLKDPLIANNPKFRALFLFKRFGYKQFFYVKDMIVREAKRGNVMPIVRLAISGFLGGEAMMWALNNIQSWLGGEPVYRKDDSIAERAFNNMALIGTFGMVGDMVEIDRLSSLAGKAKFLGAPVFVMDVDKALDAYTKFVGDWERYGDGWMATKRNAHAITGFLGSYPRYAGKRLKTESQREKREQYLKSKERREILSLLADGHAEAARDRLIDWNEHYPRNSINHSDVSLSTLREYLKRRLNSKLEAMGKVSPEERRAVIKDFRETLKSAVAVAR